MYLEVWSSAAQSKVEYVLYIGQSVVDYKCISNFPVIIYYCYELSPINFS